MRRRVTKHATEPGPACGPVKRRSPEEEKKLKQDSSKIWIVIAAVAVEGLRMYMEHKEKNKKK